MLQVKQKLPKQVKKILRQQAGVAIFLSVLCLFTINSLAAVSALLAASVCILSNLLFANTMFKCGGAQQSKKIVSAFYLGECYKILSSGVLFFLVFKYLNLNMIIFWLAFVLTQSVFLGCVNDE